MAKVRQRLIINLSKEEKKFLDDFLGELFDYADTNDSIGRIMNDIYDADMPKDGKCYTHTSENCIVTID